MSPELPVAGPGDPPAYELFRDGCRFLDEGHPGQAALLLARARDLEPDKTSIREALGRALFALRRYHEAVTTFAVVVERAPDNAYARYGLGRSLLAAGRPREAIAHARIAVAMKSADEAFAAALDDCLAALAAETTGEESVTPPQTTGEGSVTAP